MTINTVDIKEKTVFHIWSTMNEWIDMMIEVFPRDYDKAKEIANKALDDWYDIDNEDITVFEYIQRTLYENEIEASIYVYNE
jgi:hypothetical protein